MPQCGLNFHLEKTIFIFIFLFSGRQSAALSSATYAMSQNLDGMWRIYLFVAFTGKNDFFFYFTRNLLIFFFYFTCWTSSFNLSINYQYSMITFKSFRIKRELPQMNKYFFRFIKKYILK